MRETLQATLRCPACDCQGRFAIDAVSTDATEVREGTLTCESCGRRSSIERGVVDLLVQPPGFVTTEAEGLDRFAELMRESGWTREKVLQLPYVELGYWYVQARSMHQILTALPFQPGQRVLDIGSNTCWASSHFAERGLEVVALDIATTEMQGLYTADWWFEGKGVFFERVLGTMFDLPFADETFDYVFCCEVLHHNDRHTLAKTFREAHRVLRPEGKLLVVNETLRTLRDLKGNHAEETDRAQFEGYEHAFFLDEYRLAAQRAGFGTDVLEPHYRPFFGDTHLNIAPGTPWRSAIGGAFAYGLRRRSWARRAYLTYLNYVAPSSSLTMICTKVPLSLGQRAKRRARDGGKRLKERARGLLRAGS